MDSTFSQVCVFTSSNRGVRIMASQPITQTVVLSAWKVIGQHISRRLPVQYYDTVNIHYNHIGNHLTNLNPYSLSIPSQTHMQWILTHTRVLTSLPAKKYNLFKRERKISIKVNFLLIQLIACILNWNYYAISWFQFKTCILNNRESVRPLAPSPPLHLEVKEWSERIERTNKRKREITASMAAPNN